MPFSPIDTLPDAPQRSDPPDDFADRADTFVVALQTFSEQLNVFIPELEAAAALIAAAPAYADLLLKTIADASLTPAADRGVYFSSSSVAALFTLTGVARTLLAQATQAAMRETGLGMSANGSSLVSAADYAAMRTLLGLAIGTNVQAYDAELAAIAGLASAADKLPYFTGSGTAALADLTSFIRTLLDDADAAAARTTLGAAAAPVVTSNANGICLAQTIGGVTYMRQWGRVTAAANTTAGAITFPVAFTDATKVSCVANGVGDTGDTGAASKGGTVYAVSTTGATYLMGDETGCTVFWMAEGY